jgi:hypothetical protein
MVRAAMYNGVYQAFRQRPLAEPEPHRRDGVIKHFRGSVDPNADVGSLLYL